MHPENVDKVVDLLRSKGIDAVSFLDPQAARPDKFVVNESGVLFPFMSPQDSLKAVILVEDTVINTGVAGGTVPRGTPVIADKLVQHDVRAYADGLPAGQIEGFDSPYLPADVKLCKELCAAAVACGLEPAVGTIASGDQFICGKEDVGRIKRTFGALAIDMESASAAQVCALAGVRFAALRTVTDNADDDAIEDYYELLNFAAAQSVSILTEYLKGSRE